MWDLDIHEQCGFILIWIILYVQGLILFFIAELSSTMNLPAIHAGLYIG
jgi:hypothetical protein